jgi:hypothetical protein
MIRVSVEAVEVRGPGLLNWHSSRRALAGLELYRAEPVVLEAPRQLSPAERRRAIPSVKLALGVGAGAVEQSGIDPGCLPAVFASSGADGDTISSILSALATKARDVSPTQFHNSVHNAASGYWGVAMQSREAVSSISGYDTSFAVGLLEAAVQVVSAGRPVLLVAYDVPYPKPLDGVRHIASSFGVALVLGPARSARSLGELWIETVDEAGNLSHCADDGLESLRRGNPAARGLPLLAALAVHAAGTIRLALNRGALDIGFRPC